MIDNDENIREYGSGSEEEPGAGSQEPAECSPSSPSLRKSAPKGRILNAARSSALPARFVLVVDSNNVPLMPTKRSRALSWIRTKKATPFYVRGIFCARLNQEPSARNYQDIACAIDPGSKKEGYTLKSKAHTYLNIQADAVTWVKDAVTTRREMRRGRRFRKTPYRKCRFNRSRKPGWLPPSTKARWAWKLRVVTTFKRVIPISIFVIEDIAAETKEGKRKDGTPINRRWNQAFSPLQIGKHWFYQKLRLLGKLETRKGYETKALRDKLGLYKSKKKLEESWNAHCVDSWVLAWDVVGGDPTPDNVDVVYIAPLRLHRRQLHAMQPAKGGKRRPYGGTRSMGLKRGSLVRHKDLGLVYVGGVNAKGGMTFYDIQTGKLFKRKYIVGDCKVLTWNTWMTWANSSPGTRPGVPLAAS